MTDQTEIKKKILTALEKLNGTMPLHQGIIILLEIIAAKMGVEKLDSILGDEKATQFLTSRHDSFVPPLYIFNFIYELSTSVNPKSHLDPWLTPSSPCNYFDFGATTAFCQNPTAAEIIKMFFGSDKTEIHLGDASKQLGSLKMNFDFITSFPPIGMRREPIEISGFRASNDLASTLLIQSSLLLNDNGKAVFLMPPSFLTDDKTKEVISKLGLFVDAVFAIPSGAFFPQTYIASNLIVVTKQAKGKTFIAEISSNESSNRTILDNYKNRREGKLIQLGEWVDFKTLKSFQALVSEKEIQELIRRTGYPPIRLSELALFTNALKQDNKDEVDHISNSIYLPKVGNSPVVTDPSEMKIKPKNYFQIQLDEAKANSIYVASCFNSAFGQKLRESLAVGATIPLISKLQLSNCVLPLPDVKTQLEVIEISIQISNLASDLDELKRNLWKQPKSYNSIAKKLKSINQDQEKKLVNWIDTLPFPLSSILWCYDANKDIAKKLDYLLKFFEAFSEFISMIILSALVQENEFYTQESSKWISSDSSFREWYLKATFGGWNNLSANLSKAIRIYLADAQTKDIITKMFGYPSKSFLNILESKKILNILVETSKVRNAIAHGGAPSDEDKKRKIIILEQYLNDFKEIIADGFEESRMLSPGMSSYEDGVFTVNAKELVGARTPFKEISIKSLIPLDKSKLYLTHSAKNKPVELLPFIKFVEDSNALYFYTSIESQNVRWVSYHFEKVPELNQPAENDLFRVFDLLKGNGSKN